MPASVEDPCAYATDRRFCVLSGLPLNPISQDVPHLLDMSPSDAVLRMTSLKGLLPQVGCLAEGRSMHACDLSCRASRTAAALQRKVASLVFRTHSTTAVLRHPPPQVDVTELLLAAPGCGSAVAASC